MTLAHGLRGVDVAVMCPATDVQELSGFVGDQVHVVAQNGEGLAAGLTSVFAHFAAEGRRRVIAFNSDSPHLPVSVFERAFDALAVSDVVVGPTDDGGYYLVGAKASHPGLFAGDGMGTTSALAALLTRARALGLSTYLTEAFWDIDVLADLIPLAEQLRLAPAKAPRTAAWLRGDTRWSSCRRRRRTRESYADSQALRPWRHPPRNADDLLTQLRQNHGRIPIGSLGTYVERFRFKDPVFAMLEKIAAPRLVAALAIFVGFLVAIWLRSKSAETPLDAFSWPMTASLVCAPVVYPWYLLWLLPFLRSPSILPLTVWTVSIIPTYVVWHLRTLGLPWKVPAWIMLLEYGSVAVAAAIIALPRFSRTARPTMFRGPGRVKPTTSTQFVAKGVSIIQHYIHFAQEDPP